MAMGNWKWEMGLSWQPFPEVAGGGAGAAGDAVFADHDADLGEDAPGFGGVLAEAVAPPAAPVGEFGAAFVGLPGGHDFHDVRQEFLFG